MTSRTVQWVETSYTSDAEGEQRLIDNLSAEMEVDVGEQVPPKYYTTARGWLNFPNKPAPLSDYFDVNNSQAMWLELCNLVLRIEADGSGPCCWARSGRETNIAATVSRAFKAARARKR